MASTLEGLQELVQADNTRDKLEALLEQSDLELEPVANTQEASEEPVQLANTLAKAGLSEQEA